MTPGQIGAEPCNGTVLVVDDDDDVRETLRELLELHGHPTVGAHDGAEALELLRSSDRICFMVLDLQMPNLNGLQVLKALAVDPRLQRLNVCISTASVDRAPVGVPLLPKPVDFGRLLTMVEASCLN